MLPALSLLWLLENRSFGGKNNPNVHGAGLGIFKPLRQNPKRQGFSFSDRFHFRNTIGHDTGKFGYFRQPAAIIFLLGFKGQVHNKSIADAVQNEYSQPCNEG